MAKVTNWKFRMGTIPRVISTNRMERKRVNATAKTQAAFNEVIRGLHEAEKDREHATMLGHVKRAVSFKAHLNNKRDGRAVYLLG